jgi:tRNA pseudouridine55 synthase
VDGILIIDKPEGWTSHDVVARLRKLLKTKRVGHTGTLDPFATGVLVMLVGKATRLARFLDKDEKEYEAVIRFGFETDTGDRTGRCRGGEKEVSHNVTRDEVQRVLPRFIGDIEQTPPMYSAKKVEGKRLYELARKGVEVDRNPNVVTIRELELSDAVQPAVPTSAISVRVVCSAGTYIRTLAEDIGRAIGTGAHLEELRRTRAGRFTIGQAVKIEDLEKAEDPAALLMPLRDGVANLTVVELEEDRIERTRNGSSSRVQENNLEQGQPVQMVDQAGELIAIGYYDETEKAVRPKVVLG